MQPEDLLMILIRWAHSLAAVAWVGGALFQLAVVERAARTVITPDSATAFRAKMARAFRDLAQAGTVVFVITGAVMSFERLSRGQLPNAYAVLLGLKVVLALVMFHLAFSVARPGSYDKGRWAALMVVGVVVVLLAATLKHIYETGA